MAISKERKNALVALYQEMVADSRALVLAEYSRLSVKSMEGLRDRVREADGTFMVTKNTLLRRALEESGYDVPPDFLNGQLGTGFAQGEVPSLAKALVDFAEQQEALVIRGGFLGKDMLTAEQVEGLARLPSLDQLRAQIVGLISTPARQIATVVAGGVRQVVNVVDAYARGEGTGPQLSATAADEEE